MSVIQRIPPINPFRFAEADKIMPDKWGFPSFGAALQIDSLRPHQVKEQYYQKVATGDPICIHYHRGRIGTLNENPTELRIFEVGTNALLKNVGLISRADIPGITDVVTGEQLYTEQFLFTPSSLSELDGKRYIYMELWFYYAPDLLFKYRSNPIELKAKHTGTVLVEYNQKVNGHDILFEQLYPRFAYRIESKGMSFEPGGDYTTFEDQDRSTVTLDAEAFNVFKWDLGGFHGLPEHMIDIINRSLQCCKDGYFRVDGREYVAQDGKLESTGGEGKHVQWRSVTLRQKEEQEGWTNTQRKIAMFTASGYPFAIGNIELSDNFTSVFVTTNGGRCKVFDDVDVLDDWIADFNLALIAAGYAGVIYRTGSDVYLVNAEGERLVLGYNVDVFPKLLTLTYQVTLSSERYARYVLSYPDTLSHSHVVCYGAATGAEELKASVYGSSSITVDKDYASNGSKTVRIFHRDEETGFNCTKQGLFNNLAVITNISGVVSSKLAEFRINGHDFSGLTTLPLTCLAPAKNTLFVLSLNNNRIKGITANWAQALAGGGYKPFFRLGQTEIRNNEFSSANVDAFLNEFYNYCRVLLGPFSINLKGNSPAAPPTGSSSAARSGFAAIFWTITTD